MSRVEEINCCYSELGLSHTLSHRENQFVSHSLLLLLLLVQKLSSPLSPYDFRMHATLLLLQLPHSSLLTQQSTTHTHTHTRMRRSRVFSVEQKIAAAGDTSILPMQAVMDHCGNCDREQVTFF